MGVLALNLTSVYSALVWVGDEINGLLDFYKTGAKYVCGESYTDHFFIFGISSLIFFFGALLGVLTYFGTIQTASFAIASALQATLRTSPSESVVAAANIFLGGVSALSGTS